MYVGSNIFFHSLHPTCVSKSIVFFFLYSKHNCSLDQWFGVKSTKQKAKEIYNLPRFFCFHIMWSMYSPIRWKKVENKLVIIFSVAKNESLITSTVLACLYFSHVELVFPCFWLCKLFCGKNLCAAKNMFVWISMYTNMKIDHPSLNGHAVHDFRFLQAVWYAHNLISGWCTIILLEWQKRRCSIIKKQVRGDLVLFLAFCCWSTTCNHYAA